MNGGDIMKDKIMHIQTSTHRSYEHHKIIFQSKIKFTRNLSFFFIYLTG